jgi:hypothetical protein
MALRDCAASAHAAERQIVTLLGAAVLLRLLKRAFRQSTITEGKPGCSRR